MLEITWVIEMSYVMKILSLPQLYQIGVCFARAISKFLENYAESEKSREFSACTPNIQITMLKLYNISREQEWAG